MACFSPKPLYQTSEPTLASAALVQANRFAQQGRYDQALRLIEGEAEDSPTSLMVRMVCEWKGLKDLDRALATYEALRGLSDAPHHYSRRRRATPIRYASSGRFMRYARRRRRVRGRFKNTRRPLINLRRLIWRSPALLI